MACERIKSLQSDPFLALAAFSLGCIRPWRTSAQRAKSAADRQKRNVVTPRRCRPAEVNTATSVSSSWTQWSGPMRQQVQMFGAPPSRRGNDSDLNIGELRRSWSDSLTQSWSDSPTQELDTSDQEAVAAALEKLRTKRKHATIVEIVDQILVTCRREDLRADVYGAYLFALKKLQMFKRLNAEWQYVCVSSQVANMDKNGFVALVTGLADAESGKESLAAAEEMRRRGFPLTDRVVNSIVQSSIREGNPEQAVACLYNGLEDEVPPRRSLMSRVLNFCIRTHATKLAVGLIIEMRVRDVSLESGAFCSLLNLVRLKKQFDLAWVLLEEIERHADVDLDNTTYNLLLCSAARHLSAEETDLFKRKLQDLGLQCKQATYGALIQSATRGGELDRGMSTYTEMLSKGMKPTREIFASLISLCCRVRALDKAFEVHQHMTLCGNQPSLTIFNSLMKGCGQAGDVERMKLVIDAMDFSGVRPDVVTYSTLVDAYGRIGRVEDAFATVDTMIASNVEPNLVTFTHLINAAVRAGHMDAAFKVFELIEQRNMKPNVFTYSSLINGLMKRGELSKAIELLEQMRCNGVQPTIVTYATLLKSCGRLYDEHTMLDIVNRMKTDLMIEENDALEELINLCRDSKLPLNGVSMDRLEAVLRRLETLLKRGKT